MKKDIAERELAELNRDKGLFDEKLGDFNFGGTPSCMYFYYIGPPRGGARAPYIRHYYYTRIGSVIRPDELEERVKALTTNARKDERLQNPPPYGANLDYIVWSRKSYIAFIIDDDDVKLDANEPITLDYDETGKANLSFFDGFKTSISVDGSQARSVVWFINHMKRNTQGSDLRPRDLDVMPFRLNRITQRSDRTYPDSGGTNMGPPVGPP